MRIVMIGQILAMVLVAGCTMPHTGTPVAQTVKGDDSLSRIRFQREISQRRLCSNDDAFHLLIEYADGKDTNEDYAARVQWMRERRMLPDGFDQPGDESVHRGTLAVAITRVLQMRGGIMLHVLPTSERYATRELVYRGIYPQGSSPQQTYSGLEVIGVLAKMEDQQTGDPSNLPASQLNNQQGPQ